MVYDLLENDIKGSIAVLVGRVGVDNIHYIYIYIHTYNCMDTSSENIGSYCSDGASKHTRGRCRLQSQQLIAKLLINTCGRDTAGQRSSSVLYIVFISSMPFDWTISKKYIIYILWKATQNVSMLGRYIDYRPNGHGWLFIFRL